MAVYEVTGSDGAVYEVTAPDDATEQQVYDMVAQQIGSSPVNAAAPSAAKPFSKDMTKEEFIRAAVAMQPKLSETDFGKGFYEGMAGRGLGVIQLGSELGLTDEDPAMIQEAYKAVEKSAKGTGLVGAIGSGIGDPVTLATTLLTGGAGAVKTAGMSAAKKAIYAGATKKAAIAAARRNAAGRAMVEAGKAGAIVGAANEGLGVQKSDNLADRLESTAGGAVRGAITGAALTGAGAGAMAIGRGAREASSNIIAGMKQGDIAKVIDRRNALFSEGGRLLDAAEANNVAITPQGHIDMIKRLTNAYSTKRLSQQLHPGTLATVERLKEKASKGLLDTTELKNELEVLGTFKGRDGALASRARQAILDTIGQPANISGSPAAVDLLNQGRAQYTKASRFKDVAAPLVAAKGDANIAKSRLATYLTADKTKGSASNLTRPEREAAQEAAGNSLGESALKLMGRFGVDPGTVSRNARVPLMAQMMAYGGGGGIAAAPFTGGASALAAVPVGIGTAANAIKNLIAKGKFEKALRVIEARNVVPPARPVAPPAAPLALPAPGYRAPMTPSQIAAAQAQMAAGSAAGTASKIPPLSPGSVRSNPNEVFGEVPYATTPAAAAPQPLALPAPGTVYQPSAPEVVAPQFGPGRVSTGAEMQQNQAGRAAMQQVSLTPDILRTQRNNQVSAAEAQRAIQKATEAAQRQTQLAASAPKETIGDMLRQTQAASADRAAAIGEAPPELSVIGQALADAVKAQGQRKPLRIDIRPPVELPEVNLPKTK